MLEDVRICTFFVVHEKAAASTYIDNKLADIDTTVVFTFARDCAMVDRESHECSNVF